MQQGHIGFLLLGRLLASPQGFITDPAFQTAGGGPVVDAEQLSFLGASQGGILGGASSALTSDWDATVLAVGGLGYNLLLNRSTNFDRFKPILAQGPRRRRERVYRGLRQSRSLNLAFPLASYL